MTENDIIELIAETIWHAEYRRATGRSRSVAWNDNSEKTQESYRFIARTLLLKLCSVLKFSDQPQQKKG
jgi:hypothetical protein